MLPIKLQKFRIIEYMVTVWIIISFNFFLPRMMPGDPFLSLAGEDGQEIGQYSEKERQYQREWYGLDQPIIEQYFNYAGNLITGKWGYSIHFNADVSEIIFQRLPWTLFLVFFSVVLSTLLGVCAGGISAWYQGRWIDSCIYVTFILVAEIPAFLLGLILLFIFAADLGWFPLSGAVTHYANHQNLYGQIKDILHHAVLPVISLSIVRTGGMYLLARNSMVSVLGKDYVRTAVAKGLTKPRILLGHVLKNAMLPIITRLFLTLGSLAGGAILVENVFSYPGLGRLMQESVILHDYPLVQGIFFFVTICVLFANFMADFLYRRLDPRIGVLS